MCVYVFVCAFVFFLVFCVDAFVVVFVFFWQWENVEFELNMFLLRLRFCFSVVNSNTIYLQQSWRILIYVRRART